MAMHRKNVEEIKSLLVRISSQIFDNHPVLFGYLYGSYATGAVHPFSDLDIAVYSARTSTREKMRLELTLALEIDERLGHRTDSEVRVINDLPLVVKGQIVTTGILIYSRDDALRADFETSVRKLYFDFLPAIRSYERQYVEPDVP
ncbi:MAG: nucleotidyltransferase domain-containing protein [Desulfobacterales bacterium]|nr:nucleotidyltransferase domain-containing protein [Desulfobacterales bacterium]